MKLNTARFVGGIILVIVAGGWVAPREAVADDGGCPHKMKAAVMPLMDTGITGRARLCISGEGVSGKLEMAQLRPGDAYTVWFVYIDDPSQCVGGGPGVCGDADFGGDKPLGVFGRYDSAVAPRDGEEDFEGRVRGLRPSRGSQIWLLVFGHGPADDADGAHLARQLLTPEDPATGVPHLGNVVDGMRGSPAAIAVFTVH